MGLRTTPPSDGVQAARGRRPRRDGPPGRLVPTPLRPTGRWSRSTHLVSDGARSDPTPLSITGHFDSNTRGDAESHSGVVPGSMPLYAIGYSNPSTEVGSASAGSTLDSGRRGHLRRAAKHATRSGTVSNLFPPVARSSSGGFMTHRGLRLGPKEMRIPPLRSAVQMGSDVSPGSSVTLGRSERH